MLEIGCNVVVLDLNTYEALKKAEQKLERLYREIKMKPSYDKENVDVALNGETIQGILLKKWEESGLGEEYQLRDDRSYWELSNHYYMADLKPSNTELDEDEECEVEDNEPF